MTRSDNHGSGKDWADYRREDRAKGLKRIGGKRQLPDNEIIEDKPGDALMAEQAAIKKKYTDALRSSGAIDHLLQNLTVQTLPTGITVALYNMEHAPEIRFEGETKPGRLLDVLYALGNVKSAVRKGLVNFINPDALIIALESNGFTLSGQLAEHRDAIMATAAKKGIGRT